MLKDNIVVVLLSLLLLLQAVPAFAAAIALPQTGQIISYSTGDDGNVRAGVTWPEQRFTDNGDESVTDNLTGIIWAKSANAPGPSVCDPVKSKTWQGALDYIACLNTNNYLGHSDWRLPNINELFSLTDFSKYNPSLPLGHPFADVENSGTDVYWSSTVHARFHTYYAWRICFWDGTLAESSKAGEYYVWPVRTGICASADSSKACVSRTGQTTSYATGDDGDLEAGIAWPSPRYSDNNDQTVTDNLTGLSWTKDSESPGPSTCSPGGYKTWQGALDYVACLNTNKYLGYNDWHLPNINELYSLIDRSKYNPAASSGHPFSSLSSDVFWTSTTYSRDTNFAWIIGMEYGYLSFGYKSQAAYDVWPVRNGPVVSTCNASINPASQTFTSTAGTGSVSVTDSSGSCAWTATSSLDWVTITSGASGAGSGTVQFSVSANTTGSDRTGNLTIAGQTFSITQSATSTGTQGCSYILKAASKNINSKKANIVVYVTATGDSCILDPTESYDWITASLSGKFTQNKKTKKWSGKVKVEVIENESAAGRIGTVDIGGQTFTVVQAGATCTYSISSTVSTISASGGTGSLTVTPTPSDCSWTADVYSKAKLWVTVSEGSSGTGTGTINYSVSENETKKARTGKINIVGSDNKVKKTFTVKQAKYIPKQAVCGTIPPV